MKDGRKWPDPACRATARVAPTLHEQGFQPYRVGAGQPRPGDDEGSPRPGSGVEGDHRFHFEIPSLDAYGVGLLHGKMNVVAQPL